jgi:hypothetical protein
MRRLSINQNSINQNALCRPIQTFLSLLVYDPNLEENITSEAQVNIKIKSIQVCTKLHSRGSQRGSSSINKLSIININSRPRKYSKPSSFRGVNDRTAIPNLNSNLYIIYSTHPLNDNYKQHFYNT